MDDSGQIREVECDAHLHGGCQESGLRSVCLEMHPSGDWVRVMPPQCMSGNGRDEFRMKEREKERRQRVSLRLCGSGRVSRLKCIWRYSRTLSAPFRRARLLFHPMCRLIPVLNIGQPVLSSPVAARDTFADR